MKIPKLLQKWGLPRLLQASYPINNVAAVTFVILLVPLLLNIQRLFTSANILGTMVVAVWMIANLGVSLYIGTIPAYWMEKERMLDWEHEWIERLPDASEWPIPAYFDEVYLNLHRVPRFANFKRSEMAKVMKALESDESKSKHSFYADAVLAQLEVYRETV